MITIHTYFCPVCGEGYESKDARDHEGAQREALRCSTCNEKLQISGFALILGASSERCSPGSYSRPIRSLSEKQCS